MNNTIAFINSLKRPQEQWAMSAADVEAGMSLPEYHPKPEAIPAVPLSAESTPDPEEIAKLIAELLQNQPSYAPGVADDISKALENLLKPREEDKWQAKEDLFIGAAMKTVAAADKFFSDTISLMYSGNLDKKYQATKQNYQNQIDAIDNQVLYIKHQLADRFNQVVETNIMNMAARNIRVNAGNVLDLTKELASETTEDMRTAESNARLKQIALEAGQKQAKESTKLAKTQLWSNMAQSAIKLGVMYETGGGTGESFGNLFAGYQMSKAVKNQSFNELYKNIFGF